METTAALFIHLKECGVPGSLMLTAIDHAIATYPHPPMRLPAYHRTAQIAS